MADLFDRFTADALLDETPSEKRIPGHTWPAVMNEYRQGEATRQQIINFFDLDSEAQTDLNALCDHMDAMNAMQKASFIFDLEYVLILMDQGMRYTTKSELKTRLGFGS